MRSHGEKDSGGGIVCVFTDGLRHRPQTTFGAVKTNAFKDPMAGSTPINVVDVICCSPWAR